jgi:hypothetical protein
MIYTPNGKVLRTEPVFGLVMLSNALAGQLLSWTVKTDVTGDEQCVTLMIVGFHFHDPDGRSQPLPPQPNVQGVLRSSVESEVLVLSDAGADITTSSFRAFGYEIRKFARRLFHGAG